LVYHYFGSKEELFRATLGLPIDPDALLHRVFADGPDRVAENLVRAFLEVWEGPASGPAVASVLRNALSHRVAGRLAREFFATQLVRRMTTMIGGDVESSEVPLRTSLVMTQLFGVALGRYLLKFEPLASTPTETVVQTIAPTVHRYLFEDLRPKRA
jgi:AcrR family transcriptional regulator